MSKAGIAMPAIVVIAPHQEICDIVNEIGLPETEGLEMMPVYPA